MNHSIQSSKNLHFLYPPGGLMIWIFIVIELLVFAIGLLAFLYSKGGDLDLFESSRLKLDQDLALINTLILLTSGYFVFLANKFFEKKQFASASNFFWLASLLGLSFIVIKVKEYSIKVDEGLLTGVNAFFDFYWLLTVFHLFHVIIGLGILVFLAYRTRTSIKMDSLDFGIQTGSAFWHMCDLIWIFLFPIIYLF